ncbi:hypothetical protein P154DRAFT_602750 [Amniculicola lignicola CBS 123094]|uniref:Uncharacterized protein n=1 Tax=Amniculicola lignicola CBS 123094 TaxID=1392246 RepID=A0A6A5W9N7_9PLEO|nr:hypothetical protein P154DRAFT_602750 [Amniculicola lignicola CBS 123094]
MCRCTGIVRWAWVCATVDRREGAHSLWFQRQLPTTAAWMSKETLGRTGSEQLYQAEASMGPCDETCCSATLLRLELEPELNLDLAAAQQLAPHWMFDPDPVGRSMRPRRALWRVASAGEQRMRADGAKQNECTAQASPGPHWLVQATPITNMRCPSSAGMLLDRTGSPLVGYSLSRLGVEANARRMYSPGLPARSQRLYNTVALTVANGSGSNLTACQKHRLLGRCCECLHYKITPRPQLLPFGFPTRPIPYIIPRSPSGSPSPRLPSAPQPVPGQPPSNPRTPAPTSPTSPTSPGPLPRRHTSPSAAPYWLPLLPPAPRAAHCPIAVCDNTESSPPKLPPANQLPLPRPRLCLSCAPQQARVPRTSSSPRSPPCATPRCAVASARLP